MAKLRVIDFSDGQKLESKHWYKHARSHAFRKRCHLVLLQHDGRSAIAVSSILGMCELSVLHWLYRYGAEGIDGLHTKPGRGRKPLLSRR